MRVYLAPPEELRREWKLKRDSTKRGYTEEQVLAELDRREPDSESFIRPQKSRAICRRSSGAPAVGRGAVGGVAAPLAASSSGQDGS